MTNAAARDRNLARVLEVLMANGTMTRASIGAVTELSKATVARLVIDLKESGLIDAQPIAGSAADTEGSEFADRPGRRPVGFGVPSSTGHVVGLSFGLRSCHAVALNLSCHEQATRLEPTPAFTSAQQATEWAAEFIASFSSSLSESGPLLRVNIALPGRVREGVSISTLPDPLSVLAGRPLRGDLEAALGVVTMLTTDADMALAGVTSLGYIDHEAAAVLFTMSTILTVATRTAMGMVDARTASLGDFLALPPLLTAGSPEPITVGVLLSVRGISDYATASGVRLTSTADLWRHEDPQVKLVRTAFAGALEAAIRVAAVTTDPDVCVLTGRLAPLALAVLSEVQQRLNESLEDPPQLVVTGGDDNGLMTALGAAQTAVALEQVRLVNAVRARGRASNAGQ